MRELLALPCRLGGLGIFEPTCLASQEITTPIVRSILSHEGRYTHGTLADQLSAANEIRTIKCVPLSSSARELKSSLPPDLQRAMDLSHEKGTSNRLTVLLTEEFGFSYTRVHLEMPLHCAITGHFTTSPQHVHVGPNSQLITPSPTH